MHICNTALQNDLMREAVDEIFQLEDGEVTVD
jgi:hypothetical protein